MSKAIKFNNIHHIKKGVQLFEVIGAGVERGKVFDANNIRNLHVKSSPVNKPFEDRPNEEVLWVFASGSPSDKERGSLNSLRDRGITRDGKVYNLNRWFWSKADAMEFIVELNTGKFSDPVDQENYDGRNWW